MASKIYVDNSNYYLCGVKQAQASGNTNLKGCDYGALYDMLTFGEAPRCARIYSARSPGGKDFDHERARQAGFDVVLAERVMGREKGVDASLAIALLSDSYELHEPGDLVILVAGDLDYVPAVQNLRKRGIEVYVAFWSSGLATKLAKAATKVVCLDGHIKKLMKPGRKKAPRLSLGMWNQEVPDMTDEAVADELMTAALKSADRLGIPPPSLGSHRWEALPPRHSGKWLPP